jgi:hypothetical protein
MKTLILIAIVMLCSAVAVSIAHAAGNAHLCGEPLNSAEFSPETLPAFS